MEELDVNTLSPADIYLLLDNLRETDPVGTKSTSEVKEARTKVGRTLNLTEKQVTKICRTCKNFYKNNSQAVRKLLLKGKTVNESVQECSTSALNMDLAAFVFWENYEARKLFPGKNIVKYPKTVREEIFSI